MEPTLLNNVVTCVNGTFIFDELIITQQPGTIEMLQVDITNMDENGIEKDFLHSPRQF